MVVGIDVGSIDDGKSTSTTKMIPTLVGDFEGYLRVPTEVGDLRVARQMWKTKIREFVGKLGSLENGGEASLR